MQTENHPQVLSIYIPTLTRQGKMLTMQIDPDNPHDARMASLIKEVAASEPQSVQDFLIALNDLIHQKK